MAKRPSGSKRALAADVWRRLFDFFISTGPQRQRVLAELDLTPRVPAPLMADTAVAFFDGLALDVANGSTREPRVSYDVFWLALLGLTE